MDLRYTCGKRMWLLVVAIFLASMMMLTAFPAFSSQGETQWGPRMKELAPDFVLKDIDGKEVRLADYRGKVVLLAFSTTWCPHCKSMPPYLNQLFGTYGDRGLEMFNIDIQEPLSKVRAFATKYDIKYGVLLDEKAEAARAYNVMGVPSLILVDKDGTIICKQCRSVDTLLEKLLPKTQ